MRYVISVWGEPVENTARRSHDGTPVLTRTPQVVIDLGGVGYSTSGGAFELPPDYQGIVPEEYCIVALDDTDHSTAVALGYEPVYSLDECRVM